MGLNRSIPLGFPDQIIAKLRYHDGEPIASVSGALGKYSYRWNSTFDPDYTGTGHQPLFRDTFAGIYDQYAVVSAVAKITFCNVGAYPCYVGAITEDDSTSSTLLDVLCEQTHGWHKLLPAEGGSLSSVTVTLPWSAKKILNIDPFTSQTYKTAIGSNPTEESYLTLWVVTADGTTGKCYVDTTIEQTVLWTELSTPTES